MSLELRGMVTVPADLAALIDRVFLPRNPNKMRGAAPEVVEGAKTFKRLVATGGDGTEELAKRLAKGWLKYTELFGEAPRGTVKQLAAVIELSGEASS